MAVGITIWRLPPSATDDTKAMRVEANTPLSAGDHVFLTVESPRPGHLYVIDRETYSDETFGGADLIFPITRIRNGNNKIQAGVLVRIPDAADQPSYFTMTSATRKHIGEAVTVIIKPEPIADLQIKARSYTLPEELFERWESSWAATAVEQFSLVGAAGQAITEAEKESSTGRTRKMTYDDPLPQIIYRISAKRDGPIFVTLPLSLRTKQQ
ncbi:MAG TPA: hypothetical protein VJZ26_06995 [Blastocatellia bacterium]|nr:hypothetical protein [Blastocatellia bacterium]